MLKVILDKPVEQVNLVDMIVEPEQRIQVNAATGEVFFYVSYRDKNGIRRQSEAMRGMLDAEVFKSFVASCLAAGGAHAGKIEEMTDAEKDPAAAADITEAVRASEAKAAEETP